MIRSIVRGFFRSRAAISSAEYGLVAGLVAMGIMVGMQATGKSVNDIYCVVARQIDKTRGNALRTCDVASVPTPGPTTTSVTPTTTTVAPTTTTVPPTTTTVTTTTVPPTTTTVTTVVPPANPPATEGPASTALNGGVDAGEWAAFTNGAIPKVDGKYAVAKIDLDSSENIQEAFLAKSGTWTKQTEASGKTTYTNEFGWKMTDQTLNQWQSSTTVTDAKGRAIYSQMKTMDKGVVLKTFTQYNSTYNDDGSLASYMARTEDPPGTKSSDSIQLRTYKYSGQRDANGNYYVLNSTGYDIKADGKVTGSGTINYNKWTAGTTLLQ